MMAVVKRDGTSHRIATLPALAAFFIIVGLACSRNRPADGPKRGSAGAGTGGASAVGAGGGGGALESRICQQSGRFSAVDAEGHCPPVSDLARLLPNVIVVGAIDSRNYSGSLPKCVNQDSSDPGFRFRVDQLLIEKNLAGIEQVEVFDSILIGANLDATPICGTHVWLTSPTERLDVATGRVLVVTWRRVQHSDYDGTAADIIYDENRQPSYAYVTSRPDFFANDLGDLFPGLNVEISSNVICTVPDTDLHFLSLRLSTGADTCDIDSHSERCCTLWGRPYEVQANAVVVGPTTTRPY